MRNMPDRDGGDGHVSADRRWPEGYVLLPALLGEQARDPRRCSEALTTRRPRMRQTEARDTG